MERGWKCVPTCHKLQRVELGLRAMLSQFLCTFTGMCPAVQHSPLPLPAHETPPPLPPRSDSHSLPTTDEQLQSTPCPLPPPVEEPPPIPLSPRLSPSSPHLLIRQPSYSSTDTSEEAPSSPVEEPLSLPSPRRAPPPPPTSMGVPSSYLHSPV